MTIWLSARKFRLMLSSSLFHQEFLPLRISTHEIGITGQKFSHALSLAALNALLFEPKNELFSWSALSGATVNFFLERENEHTFKVGIQTNLLLSCACVRCLTPVPMSIPIDFFIRMLQKERFAQPDDEFGDLHFDTEELEIDADEDSLVGYFSDKCIDLGIILRDQIFLQVPDYPQCKDGGQTDGCRKDLSLVQQDTDGGQKENPFVKLFSKKTT